MKDEGFVETWRRRTPQNRPSLRIVLLGVFSLACSTLVLLYTFNGWPFERPGRINCALRTAHASLLGKGPGRSPSSAALASLRHDGPRAEDLLPSDLMNGKGRPVEVGRVPRYIHQSWKDRSPPRRFVDWAASWRSHHPNWSYVLWTDDDNRELVRRFYPQYLEAYEALPSEIYRADMARNCYMHRFGGVYADFDVESLRPLEPLLDNPTLAEHEMIAYTARLATTQDPGALMNSIPNAFMASTAPAHPFWLRPLDYIVAHLAEHADQPEWLTGPVPLTRLATAYESTAVHRLVVLPPHLIFPYSWDTATPYQHCVCSGQEPTLDTRRCKALFGDAFAVTYWSHSWSNAHWDVLDAPARNRRRRYLNDSSVAV